jgi:putative tricarboxylic transport membrane protein
VDTLAGLYSGFAGLLSAENLLATLTGAVLGTVVGVLPCLGPVATMAILLPITLSMGPAAGLVLLTGVFYGAQYGGSTTSILLRIPGEATSVITCLDGYEMTKQNRAGPALTAAAIGSFIAGTIGFIAITLFALPVSKLALKFGPPELFSISACGLLVLSNTSGGNFWKNLMMIFVGVMLATVGTDAITGTVRFDYGFYKLSRGIDYIPVLIGLFGMAEIIHWALSRKAEPAPVAKVRMRDLYPTREDTRRMVPAMFRGSIVGFLVGLLPGPGAILSTYASYALEKKLSRRPQEFGHGAIEGVAGPESANNSALAGGLIMLLSLGLPFSGVTAILLGALTMHGIAPGPTFIAERPEVFWIFIASLYLGNVVMLILNLPLVPLFVAILRIPMRVLVPLITLMCIVGTYSLANQWVDVWIMLATGAFGLLMRVFDFEAPPLVLGMVFGPLLEVSFGQSLVMFNNNLMGFWARPLSGIFLGLAILIPVVSGLVKLYWRRSDKGVSAG